MHDRDHPFLSLPLSAAPADDESAAFSHGGWDILLCRSGGKLFAVENRCTHRAQKLEGGRVRRGHIFCPHHGARFTLATGVASGPPATAPLRIFPCREAESGLVIDLPAAAEGRFGPGQTGPSQLSLARVLSPDTEIKTGENDEAMQDDSTPGPI